MARKTERRDERRMVMQGAMFESKDVGFIRIAICDGYFMVRF